MVPMMAGVPERKLIKDGYNTVGQDGMAFYVEQEFKTAEDANKVRVRPFPLLCNRWHQLDRPLVMWCSLPCR